MWNIYNYTKIKKDAIFGPILNSMAGLWHEFIVDTFQLEIYVSDCVMSEVLTGRLNKPKINSKYCSSVTQLHTYKETMMHKCVPQTVVN